MRWVGDDWCVSGPTKEVGSMRFLLAKHRRCMRSKDERKKKEMESRKLEEIFVPGAFYQTTIGDV